MLPPIRAYQAQAQPAPARRAGPRGFAAPQGAAGEVAAIAAIPSSQGMLGLQEEWSAADSDAAARRRGLAVLRELEGLQLALLEGGVEASRLSRLALLAEGDAGADPMLREIIGEISLRARVELARRGR